MEKMKINRLEIENVKRVKAVKIEPNASGLTIIGGDNNQGKTSVLDAITWALGGDAYRPSKAVRDGSVTPPNLSITMSNGLLVERKGKNSSLYVTDTTGRHEGGQQILNAFVEALALNLPKFMEASDKEKADTLLNIIGVGPQLAELEKEEAEIYNERISIGRIADRKEKYAKEQTYYPDAPKDIVSAADLIKQQQDILAKNGENERLRSRLTSITQEKHRLFDEAQRIEEQISDLQKRKKELVTRYEKTAEDETTAMKTVAQLKDESTAELERSISDIDEINRKVRANLDRDKAEDDAREYLDQYTQLTQKLNDVRIRKTDLLNGAKLPLSGLSVSNGKLTYNGQQWDNMSGSDRLIVATSIVRELNPKCGFVLLDKLEQMDLDTLNAFGVWLQSQGIQAIATRVSKGDECQIIIDDGYAVKNTTIKPEQDITPEPKKTWKKGEF